MRVGWTVITGACGGLGKEFCLQYAQKGCDLFLAGTSETRLEALKEELLQHQSINIQTQVCDLSCPEQIKQFCDQLEKMEVERLVCNAGIGEYGRFDEMSETVIEKMQYINMHALTMMNRAVLKSMKVYGGEILNVSSTAAFECGPMMAVYYAAKSYVLSFSEALAMEMKPKGVKVAVLCCGPMQTDFAKKAHLKHTAAQKLLMISPAKAVHEGIRGLEKGKIIIVTGTFNRIAIFFAKLLPHSWVRAFMNWSQSKRSSL